MQGSFTIGELSKILGIEKSTLRYWDQNGLISLGRNNDNNYREYSKKSVIEISDIAFYRSINMPIKKLKNLNVMKTNELESTLEEMEENLAKEIEALETKKRTVQWRQEHIKEYYALLEAPYQRSEPDMTCMVQFDFHNKNVWSQCLYNPYCYSIYIGDQESRVQNAFATEDSKKQPLLWLREESRARKEEYVACIVRFASNDYANNNLDEHRVYFSEMGWIMGQIVGRYLFTAFDEEKYDYHKVWIQIKG